MHSHHNLLSNAYVEGSGEPAISRDIFLLTSVSELSRLANHVKESNLKRYDKEKFTLQFDPELDPYLIVAPTPNLGSDQLGLYAGRKFYKGQRVAVYTGTPLCKKGKSEKVKRFCKDFKGIEDYIWQVKCGDGDSVAVDASLNGSVARFINDAEDANVEMEYVNGQLYYIATRDIDFGEEITTKYGDDFFYNKVTKESYYQKRKSHHLENFFREVELADIRDVMATTNTQLDLKNLPNEVQIVNKSIEFENQKELYLNEEKKPLIFHLDGNLPPEDAELLNSVTNKEILLTSKKKLIVAPLEFDSEKKRVFGLFAGKRIKKNEEICTISGEILKKNDKETQKKVKLIKEKNSDELFDLGPHYVSLQDKASVALFIQGSKRESCVNTKIRGSKFIATKSIPEGKLILGNLGKNYPYDYSSRNFVETVKIVNKIQNNEYLNVPQPGLKHASSTLFKNPKRKSCMVDSNHERKKLKTS